MVYSISKSGQNYGIDLSWQHTPFNDSSNKPKLGHLSTFMELFINPMIYMYTHIYPLLAHKPLWWLCSNWARFSWKRLDLHSLPTFKCYVTDLMNFKMPIHLIPDTEPPFILGQDACAAKFRHESVNFYTDSYIHSVVYKYTLYFATCIVQHITQLLMHWYEKIHSLSLWSCTSRRWMNLFGKAGFNIVLNQDF